MPHAIMPATLLDSTRQCTLSQLLQGEWGWSHPMYMQVGQDGKVWMYSDAPVNNVRNPDEQDPAIRSHLMVRHGADGIEAILYRNFGLGVTPFRQRNPDHPQSMTPITKLEIVE